MTATSTSSTNHATSRLRLAVGVVVALLLALVVAIRVLDDDAADDGAAVAATTAADVTAELGPRVEELLSYTPGTVSSDLAEESAYLTGEFKSAFDTLVRERIAPTSVKSKISTEAEVVETAVVEAEPDTVVALLFVNVTTDSSELPEPRLSGSRLQITLERVGDDWLISELDPL